MPVQELSYLLVAPEGAEEPASAGPAPPAPAVLVAGAARYTHSLLRQTLQLVGAKPRQSDKAAHKVFLILQQRAALPPSEPLSLAGRLHTAAGGHAGVALARLEFDRLVMDCLAASDQQQPQPQQQVPPVADSAAAPLPVPAASDPALQQPPADGGVQRQHDVLLGAPAGASAAVIAATAAAAVGDFRIACALREQRASVAVLLCGTSGTGKSTLAALLAARLGISTVVSTDSIRHMMRSFSSEAEDPLLWASTYEAGLHLQAPVNAAQAQQPRQPQAAPASSALPTHQLPYHQLLTSGSSTADPRKAAIRGYKAQSARVLEHVDRLLAGCEARRQSLVVEGVHLSLSMVVRMMQRHPSVVPFLVHISNEAKHMERFAVRSKVMTLRPDGNRYVKYFRNIRAIQDYLVKSAEKHAIPKVDNTNVDRSVATIHTTVLGCLRRTARGESMLSGSSLSCKLLLEEYLRCQSATWSSSDMLDLIRRKSAAGQPPSPSEAASTTTRETSTPHAPLSDAPADEHLRLVASGRASSIALARPGDASGKPEVAHHDYEGDNRSFYGSESQSSSDEGGGSTSCSCSSSNSEYGEEEEAEEVPQRRARRRNAGGSSTCGEQIVADGGSGQQAAADVSANGDVLSTLGLPQRRQRHRDRRKWHGRGRGSGNSSTMGEIPAGLVPESMRRRSEVGSVLDSEQQSDTEDAELSTAVLAVQA